VTIERTHVVAMRRRIGSISAPFTVFGTAKLSGVSAFATLRAPRAVTMVKTGTVTAAWRWTGYCKVRSAAPDPSAMM
jgi:hypothetical protein